ncbi:hypothetical protein AB0B88_16030 [Micromonospora haikouensis]|uniref:hypothetical protein n=1 Tax=Micromonospora haikouensis TaxID=686309 RepID=UPI0033EA5D47
MTVTEAVRHTGLSRSTLQRRAQAWIDGDRSPYALKAGRTGGDRGDRVIDRVDAERVRLQRLGELPGAVTAHEYAATRARPE